MKKNFLGMMKTLVWTLFVMIVVSASDCYVPINEESVAVCSQQPESDTQSYNLNSAKNYNEANDFRLNLP